MKRQPPSDAPPRGKVLAFVPPARPNRVIAAESARAARSLLERRRQLLDSVSGRAWIILAWFVAAERLSLAIARQEVFGSADTLAFIVAVVILLMRARAIADVLAHATQ